MRPVNLIPAEDRRGGSSPLRTGPVVYVLIGALLLALAGVTSLVLTKNEIVDRKAEAAQLRKEVAATTVEAERLSAYTQFRAVREQRIATVKSLADSRFDWERVMRELALVLPTDVWLTELNATASPGVAIDGGSSGSSLRSGVPGPALTLKGCARGQAGVADLVVALRDIDAVTRVGVQSSLLPEVDSASGSSTGEGGGGGSECQTRDFIAEYEVVVAFDAAPVPISAEGAAEVAPVAETASESTTEGEEG
jgi:Tfp pilus assembly protein PilN